MPARSARCGTREPADSAERRTCTIQHSRGQAHVQLPPHPTLVGVDRPRAALVIDLLLDTNVVAEPALPCPWYRSPATFALPAGMSGPERGHAHRGSQGRGGWCSQLASRAVGEPPRSRGGRGVQARAARRGRVVRPARAEDAGEQLPCGGQAVRCRERGRRRAQDAGILHRARGLGPQDRVHPAARGCRSGGSLGFRRHLPPGAGMGSEASVSTRPARRLTSTGGRTTAR